VTGPGDFPPFERLSTLGRLLKFVEVAKLLSDFFHEKSKSFDKQWMGLHFGRFSNETQLVTLLT
jgi:hypothetical protein